MAWENIGYSATEGKSPPCAQDCSVPVSSQGSLQQRTVAEAGGGSAELLSISLGGNTVVVNDCRVFGFSKQKELLEKTEWKHLVFEGSRTEIRHENDEKNNHAIIKLLSFPKFFSGLERSLFLLSPVWGKIKWETHSPSQTFTFIYQVGLCLKMREWYQDWNSFWTVIRNCSCISSLIVLAV